MVQALRTTIPLDLAALTVDFSVAFCADVKARGQ